MSTPVRSVDEVTRRPVSILPPCAARTEARASLIARDPPFATGQPKAWQASISAHPTDELISWLSGLKAWAATPPKRARACGVFQRRARTEAGAPAGVPKRAGRNGGVGRGGIRGGHVPPR